MEKYIYELEMKVRDYECDLQGIVNNANYQHYLEHTRHEFLLSTGVSFAGLHEQGVDPVVARINMAFKTPLKSGQKTDILAHLLTHFLLRDATERGVLREHADILDIVQLTEDTQLRKFRDTGQDIFRKSDDKVVIKATVETVCLVNGRLSDSKLFDEIFEAYL